MIDTVRTKVRALIEDSLKNDEEVFEYTISKIFTLAESNIMNIAKVLKNGVELGSGEYSYDSVTGKIDITASLSNGDIIEVDYTYYQYSDTELDGHITSALVWFSIFDTSQKDYEIEDGDIIGTPTNQELDVISLITSILIKPNYSEYRLPTMTVRYQGRTKSKEDKIAQLMNRWTYGIGQSDIISFD